MRILIVGAEGTIGRAVTAALSGRHEVIKAGRKSGDVQVDIGDRRSIEALYAKIGKVDAVVAAAGHVHFGPLAEMTHDQFMSGLNNKLMGQVDLVLAGIAHVNDNGSFTLTSGILDRDPIRAGTNAATVNAALGGFVLGAAIELPRGLRINVVSPALLDESAEKLGSWFPGQETVAAARVAKAYVKSVEGAITGKVITLG
jgi:NAD(P)-dependent dehydrogenase (short-subunit alcohol dehydrogenase family)